MNNIIKFNISKQYLIINQNKLDNFIKTYNDTYTYQQKIALLKSMGIIKQNPDWVFLWDLYERSYMNSQNELKKCYLIKKFWKNRTFTFSIPEKIIKKTSSGIFYYHNDFEFLKKYIINETK